MVVPNNHGVFLVEMIILGVLGVPPFKETPIWQSVEFMTNLRSENYWVYRLPGKRRRCDAR